MDAAISRTVVAEGDDGGGIDPSAKGERGA
jgi:hypothetical protein